MAIHRWLIKVGMYCAQDNRTVSVLRPVPDPVCHCTAGCWQIFQVYPAPVSDRVGSSSSSSSSKQNHKRDK